VTAFDEVRVGDELPLLRRLVTREDVKAYADASGDQNPLHQDDEMARRVGFEGIIAHGMFTMGHMAACVMRWAGEGAEVLRISATFRSPVSMGETIVAGGRVRAIVGEERSVAVETWVTVERGGREEFPVKRGDALVRLPRR
jgi:acyl dehydratase